MLGYVKPASRLIEVLPQMTRSDGSPTPSTKCVAVDERDRDPVRYYVISWVVIKRHRRTEKDVKETEEEEEERTNAMPQAEQDTAG